MWNKRHFRNINSILATTCRHYFYKMSLYSYGFGFFYIYFVINKTIRLGKERTLPHLGISNLNIWIKVAVGLNMFLATTNITIIIHLSYFINH